MKELSIVAFIAFALFIGSCRTHVPQSAASFDYLYNCNTLEGAYTGNFGDADIHIFLTHVTGKHAIGYDLYKGLRRNISGIMQQSSNGYSFLLNEPGDHHYDGKFNFTIDTATFILSGSWIPLNDKSISKKVFTLKKNDSLQTDDITTWSDSIGEFTFKRNGICVYEFYPVINGKSAEQLIRVKGTWSLKDSNYTVDWEPNTAFSSRKSIFTHKLVRYDSTSDETYEQIRGEGHILTQEEAP